MIVYSFIEKIAEFPDHVLKHGDSGVHPNVTPDYVGLETFDDREPLTVNQFIDLASGLEDVPLLMSYSDDSGFVETPSQEDETWVMIYEDYIDVGANYEGELNESSD